MRDISTHSLFVCLLFTSVLCLALVGSARAQFVGINEITANTPQANAAFGGALSILGELEGTPVLAIGEPGVDRVAGGAINPDGTFQLVLPVAASDIGLSSGIRFGASIAGLPDFDDSGLTALVAVGAPEASGGGVVYLAQASPIAPSLIGDITGADVGGGLSANAAFGISAALLTGDAGEAAPTTTLVAVGAPGATDGSGAATGAVYLFEIVSDGTSGGTTVTQLGSAIIPSAVADGARLGTSIAALDDLDEDTGTLEIAVGAAGADGGRGVVHILSVSTADGSATLLDTYGGSADNIPADADFGTAAASHADVGGNTTLLVGAPGLNGDAGGYYHLSVATDGTVAFLGRVEASSLPGVTVGADARFGASLTTVDDLDGNSFGEVITGAPGFDGTATGQGAAYAQLTAQAVLPVELASFRGHVEGRDVILSWRTLSETDNDGFAVERKKGGKEEWKKVVFIEGRGTPSAGHTYEYRAEDLRPGSYAFRLRETDVDGTTRALGHTLEVTVRLAERFALGQAYPSPFQREATFTLDVKETQQVQAALYNTLGQRVRTLYNGLVEAGRGRTFTIEGVNLASGLYFYRVRGETFAATGSVVRVR